MNDVDVRMECLRIAMSREHYAKGADFNPVEEALKLYKFCVNGQPMDERRIKQITTAGYFAP